MILARDDIIELTGKVRRSAQARVLDALGIPYRRRTDGSIVVFSVDLHPKNSEPLLMDLERDSTSLPWISERMTPNGWFDAHRSKFISPLQVIERRAVEYIRSAEYPCPCIYFLFYGRELQYVGKSVNVNYRLSAHEKTKPFDRVAFIEVPETFLNRLELYYIQEFNPRLNVAMVHHATADRN